MAYFRGVCPTISLAEAERHRQHKQLAEFLLLLLLLPWPTNAGYKAKETCLLLQVEVWEGREGQNSCRQPVQMNSNCSNLERWNIA